MSLAERAILEVSNGVHPFDSEIVFRDEGPQLAGEGLRSEWKAICNSLV